MKIKPFITFSLSFLLFASAMAQTNGSEGQKKEQMQTKYDRNALTIVLLDNNASYMQDLKSGMDMVSVPDKFDDNLLEKRFITGTSDEMKIKKGLIEDRIPNHIVAKWFNRDEQGNLSMSVIHERGLYNASDDEVRKAASTKVGMARIQDAGQTLLDHSYIMVLKAHDIKTMDQVYDAKDRSRKAAAALTNSDFTPVKRNKNGFQGKVTAYLYQLDFNDSVLYDLYDRLWIYEDDNDEAKKTKAEAFFATKFPLKYITKVSASADGSQYNAGHVLSAPKQLSRTELFAKLINTGIEGTIFEIENNVQEFQVKIPLYDRRPLRAKIGKKEGVQPEQRFFVVEFEMNSKGETVPKRKGVVRAKKVVDNRQVSTGNMQDMSRFYQTAGRRLEPGMLMQQKNDLGAGISLGYSSGAFGGAFAKVELNVGQMANKAISMNATQVKLIGYGSIDAGSYMPLGEAKEYDFTFVRYYIGISKGFYFLRNFSLAPFVSMGIEQASGDDYLVDVLGLDDEDQFEQLQFQFGANLSINIKHNVQLIGGATIYNNVGTVTTKKDATLEDYTTNEAYSDFFSDRKTGEMTIDIGLRFEF
jgi:hypothetical protein